MSYVEQFTPAFPKSRFTEPMAQYAGQSVGLVQEVLPAGEIVRRLATEAEAVLRALPR